MGLQTSFQERKEEQRKGPPTRKKYAHIYLTIEVQTSHQTLVSSITKRTHHLDPVCEIQPTRTHPPRAFGLNLSAVQSISLERSAKGSHRTPLDGIAIHHTTGEQTSLYLRFDLVRDVHHPRQTPCNLSHHQQLNNNVHSFNQLDTSISRALQEMMRPTRT